MIIKIINIIAAGIGYTVIIVILLLVLLAIISSAYDLLRAKFPKLDRWLYDETKRWNRKRRNIPKGD